MADQQCPPNEGFGIVFPQDAKNMVGKLEGEIAALDVDVQSEKARRKKPSSSFTQFLASWDAWKAGALKFVEGNNEWSEIALSEGPIYRQAQLYRCDVISYRKKLQDLGGETSSPEPPFERSETQETLSKATTLLLVGVGAFLVFQLVPRKR